MFAYSSSYTHQTSERGTPGVFHSIGARVRARFSRTTKPIDHLGGLHPEERLPARVLEAHVYWSMDQENQAADNRHADSDRNYGSTHEYMEVSIG